MDVEHEDIAARFRELFRKPVPDVTGVRDLLAQHPAMGIKMLSTIEGQEWLHTNSDIIRSGGHRIKLLKGGQS